MLKLNLSSNSNTGNSHPTSATLKSAKLFLRVEWNETFRTRRNPFSHKKFTNHSPEILVEWIVPADSVSPRMNTIASPDEFNLNQLESEKI